MIMNRYKILPSSYLEYTVLAAIRVRPYDRDEIMVRNEPAVRNDGARRPPGAAIDPPITGPRK